MKKKLFTLSMLSLLALSLGACSTAESNNSPANEDIRAIYELYQANGGTQTYEDWLASIKGDKGDKGEKGDTGAQGPKGDKGDKGDTGAAGTNGQDGAPGAKGDKGDKGDTGTSVDGFTVTTDKWGINTTYTLTLSDGTVAERSTQVVDPDRVYHVDNMEELKTLVGDNLDGKGGYQVSVDRINLKKAIEVSNLAELKALASSKFLKGTQTVKVKMINDIELTSTLDIRNNKVEEAREIDIDTNGHILSLASTSKSVDLIRFTNDGAILQPVRGNMTLKLTDSATVPGGFGAFKRNDQNEVVYDSESKVENAVVWLGTRTNDLSSMSLKFSSAHVSGKVTGLITNGTQYNGTLSVQNSNFETPDGYAAYLPANVVGANYCFYKSTFTGKAGLYIKSGSYSFQNCTFNINGAYEAPQYNGNGCTGGTGDAIIVDSTVGYQDTLNIVLKSGNVFNTTGYAIEEVMLAKAGTTPVDYAVVSFSGATTTINTANAIMGTKILNEGVETVHEPNEALHF